MKEGSSNPSSSEFLRDSLLDAYVAAMKRSRWALLTSTLLAAMLVTTVLLQEWGFMRNQLEGLLANRVAQKTPSAERLDTLAHWTGYLLANRESAGLQAQTLRDSLNRLSKKWWHRRETDNTLAARYIGDRHVPLLGLDAPEADYPTLLSIMLAVLMVVVALNARAIYGQVQRLTDLRQNPHVPPEVIRVHFTFTGLPSDHLPDDGRTNLTRRIEYAAYALPAAAILIASAIHLGMPQVERWLDHQYYFGSKAAIVLLVIVHSVCFIVAVLSAMSATSRSRATDWLLHDAEMAERIGMNA